MEITDDEVILEENETACRLSGYSMRPHNKFSGIPAVWALFSSGRFIALVHAIRRSLFRPCCPKFTATFDYY